ncbi:hypothetical protein MAQ5080_02580 [Marinomonas aquimarina]|uniref:Uncharacterized protein n=1 Tax=Marinomonas aquimarina TaxID=295068 RepID=A0A1A8TLQ1_9GAMM|nr:hypothetical protein [Marinomonas aquimarina]SBS33432.1 hypothetical protein MAQ5080_02580 [Marinomonas aquimarina]
MDSTQIKLTQKRLAQLIDDTLYPQGSTWTQIAILVKSNPNIDYYTLCEIEEQIDKKGFAALVAVLRLSMPPYNVFETSFELLDEDQQPFFVSLGEYQQCILNGGITASNGQFIDSETINKEAVIHLQVKR